MLGFAGSLRFTFGTPPFSWTLDLALLSLGIGISNLFFGRWERSPDLA
jgi:hypothetical protein